MPEPVHIHQSTNRKLRFFLNRISIKEMNLLLINNNVQSLVAEQKMISLYSKYPGRPNAIA